MEKVIISNNELINNLRLIENEDYIAVGGRVLNVVTTTKDFKQSKEQALKILNDIDWKEGFFRKDIAYKVA